MSIIRMSATAWPKLILFGDSLTQVSLFSKTLPSPIDLFSDFVYVKLHDRGGAR